jgi:hypothetical protein
VSPNAASRAVPTSSRTRKLVARQATGAGVISNRLDDPERDIARKLDEVVGERFRDSERDPMRRWGDRLAKWLVGAAGAVCAAVAVIYLIESHRLPPGAQKAPPKPVTVTIVPVTRP